MEIKTRIYNFTILPLTLGKSLAINTCKLSVGIGATFASCAAFGLSQKCNKVADWTQASARIAPEIMERTIQVIHPSYEIGGDSLDSCFATPLKKLFAEWIDNATESKKFGTKHFLSRTFAFIQMPALFIARVADFVLGILMIPSVLLHGFSNQDKNLELAGLLNLLATIDDIAIGVRGVFNPFQFANDGSDKT